MNRTRYVAVNELPTAREYLAGPEYAELRGLSLGAVFAKARFFDARRVRSLALFLQAMSLRPGGLPAMVKDMLNEFPERIGCTAMHDNRLASDDRRYSPQVIEAIRSQLNPYYHRQADDVTGVRVIDEDDNSKTQGEFNQACRRAAEVQLPTILIALCVNPKLEISVPGLRCFSEFYRDEVRRQYAELGESDFVEPDVRYFRDLIPTLFEYQQRFIERGRKQFVMTEVARIVFETLDTALESPGRIAIIEGREGIGKSEAARAWCEQHLGEARFVSLPGVTNRTAFFSAICRALGVWTKGKTPGQMQARIEELLQQSPLMLVIDEAHAMFGASDKVRVQPELVNWCYSALANFNVPVALVTTELFGKKLRQAEQQVIWNAAQFERRVRPYVKLPYEARPEDLEAIARRKLPSATDTMIDLAVGYAGMTRFPMTNLADLIAEAQRIARSAGRGSPSLADLRCAEQRRKESDGFAAEALSAAVATRRRKANAAPLQPPLNDLSEPPVRRDNLADVESAQNPRFQPSISGRTGRDLVTD